MPEFRTVIEAVGIVIDAAGVLAIVLGLLVAAVRYATTGRTRPDGFRMLRQDLGRGILLGLEILIAADIIRGGSTPVTRAQDPDALLDAIHAHWRAKRSTAAPSPASRPS